MQCLACGRKLPPWARACMRYCGAACRAQAFRGRVQARSSPRTIPESSDPATTDDAEKVTESPAPKRTRRSNRTRRMHANLSQVADRSQPAERARRVPFEQQVLCQAPPEATGYRLVLPLGSHAEIPKLAPAPSTQGELRAWCLCPFELPDDIRLRDGHVYRILWVGPQGELVAPQRTQHLPALHFFLGPADSETRGDADASILRNISDPALRTECEAELARLHLQALSHRQAAEVRAQQRADAEADQRLSQQADEAELQRRKAKTEELQRIAAQNRELEVQREAAQNKAALQNLLLQVGVLLGLPAATTAIQALTRKLDGKPVDWPELKANLARFLEDLPSLLSQRQMGEQPHGAGQEKTPTPLPSNTPSLDSSKPANHQAGKPSGSRQRSRSRA